jgi:predicted CXXCH cytochrome family protein
MRNNKKIESSATAAKFFAIFTAALLPLSISALSNQQSKPGLNQRSSSGFSATGIAGQQQAAPSQPAQSASDPAAWGSNHIGKPIPEFVHGDECLFCHRNNIGATWQKNAHGVTVRQGEDAPELQAMVRKQTALSSVAAQIEYFLGSRHRVRFLKKDGYGKFALLNSQAVLGPEAKIDKWIDVDKLSWDKERFGNRCAGCHSTAVDSTAKTFTAFGLDCYACHGDVTLEHTKDTSLIWLSKKRRDDARALTSICAQCHLRLGKSRSTGLPYPNNFIAGDNLFQDYEVDFAKADDESLNPGDRHILRNVRDVVLRGQQATTCLTCHQVHANSTAKHLAATAGPICADCHGTKFTLKVKPYAVHSSLCEY